jgi:hypothetical protein
MRQGVVISVQPEEREMRPAAKSLNEMKRLGDMLRFPLIWLRSTGHRPKTLRNITFANVTLSQTTDTTLGELVPIRSSRASRTAAMIEAQIAMVEAKRSCVLCSSSRAFARFISPMKIAPVSSS